MTKKEDHEKFWTFLDMIKNFTLLKTVSEI